VVDLGCARGEFLTALRDAGIPARGIDANAEMAAVARERGLDVAHGDALAFLESLPDESVGGLMAAQVVEHMRSGEPAARALVGLAHSLNTNAAILNNLLFSHLDYAAIGYRS